MKSTIHKFTKENLKNMKNTLLKIVTVLVVGSIMSCSPEDGVDGINGSDGANGTNGTDGVAVYYNPITLAGVFNNGAITASETDKPLNIGTRTFNKLSATTQIDIKLRSKILSGTFSPDVSAIRYELKVNGSSGNASSVYWCVNSNSSEFVPLDATFANLPAGKHTITIVARTNRAGTSTGVVVDPGGYDGKLLIQER